MTAMDPTPSCNTPAVSYAPGQDLPPAPLLRERALELIFDRWTRPGADPACLLLPPPWFVEMDAAPCGVVLDVPAAATTDGLARRFVCDRPAHDADVRHRQVTDINAGDALEWTTTREAQ